MRKRDMEEEADHKGVASRMVANFKLMGIKDDESSNCHNGRKRRSCNNNNNNKIEALMSFNASPMH
jgi:hypothetical protein